MLKNCRVERKLIDCGKIKQSNNQIISKHGSIQALPIQHYDHFLYSVCDQSHSKRKNIPYPILKCTNFTKAYHDKLKKKRKRMDRKYMEVNPRLKQIQKHTQLMQVDIVQLSPINHFDKILARQTCLFGKNYKRISNWLEKQKTTLIEPIVKKDKFRRSSQEKPRSVTKNSSIHNNPYNFKQLKPWNHDHYRSYFISDQQLY